jgi:SAM-dependent methyltransferase
VCATLSRPPFAPESCAAITMFHVLEHLYDPASYLDAAHRLLRPDGRLILQVPNAACWQFLLLGERWNGIDVPRHLIDFRISDIDSLLESCGFEVLRHKHFSLRDNPAGMATSLAPELDPMARRLRRVVETSGQRLWKDALYLALVCVSLPFTLLETACRAGSTIMVEARKKS